MHPINKYENDGGRGVRRTVELLREVSSEPEGDVETLVRAVVLSWLIAGTDAHAKNTSLLIGAKGRARLAPPYDIASALPYPGLSLQKLKLAMKVGEKYRLRDIGLHQWHKLAAELSLDPEPMVSTARACASSLPEAATVVLEQACAEGLHHPILPELHRLLCERARHCAALLAA